MPAKTSSNNATRNIAKGPRRGYVWRLLLFVLVLCLVFAMAALPSWLGKSLLAQFGSGLGLQAVQVTGWLWAPEFIQAKLALPEQGLAADLQRLGIGIQHFDPINKRVDLKLILRSGTVNFELKRWFDSLAKRSAADPQGWTINFSALESQNVQLVVAGKSFATPNIQAKMTSNTQGLRLQGRSDGAPLSMLITTQPRPTGTVFRSQFEISARALRMYWQGIEAGTFRGSYVIGESQLRGKSYLTGGKVRVPNAGFATINDITGWIEQRGDVINAKLAGQGWDGPVTSSAQLSLSEQHWQATATASPTVQGLAKALKTAGQGSKRLQITATASGSYRQSKDYLRLSAHASGSGKIFGLDWLNSRAYYLFQDGATKLRHNTLFFRSDTQLVGRQTLQGRWRFGQGGALSWQGQLASQPLALSGRIVEPSSAASSASTAVNFMGRGLGGALFGHYQLNSQQLTAQINPHYGPLRAKIALRGTFNDLGAQVLSGQAGPFALQGAAAWNQSGLQAQLSGPKVAQLRLNLGRELSGKWQLADANWSGLSLAGSGQTDLLAGRVQGSGQISAEWLGKLSGQLDLNYLRQHGTFGQLKQNERWLAQPSRLTWQGRQLMLKSADLEVLAGRRLKSDLSVFLPNDGAAQAVEIYGSGKLQGDSDSLIFKAQGNSASVRLAQRQLSQFSSLSWGGRVSLAVPFTSQLFPLLAGQKQDNLHLKASWQPTGIAFELLSRDPLAHLSRKNKQSNLWRRATGHIANDWRHWWASGRLNLAAVTNLLGPQFVGLTGDLGLYLRGLGGYITLQNGQYAPQNIQLSGRFFREVISNSALLGTWTSDLRLSYRQRLGQSDYLHLKARLVGQAYPTLRLRGQAQAVAELASLSLQQPFHATGNLQLSGSYQQPQVTFRGNSGAVSLSGLTLPTQPLLLQAQLQPRPLLTGRWGKMTLRYQGQSLRLAGRQAFQAFGQQGQAQLQAVWGSDFAGKLNLQADLAEYHLQASGPWRDLRIAANTMSGLQLQGKLDATQLRYSATVKGPLELVGQRWQLSGKLEGVAKQPQFEGSLQAASGQHLQMQLQDAGNFRINGLVELAGRSWQAHLQANQGLLSGSLAGNLAGQKLNVHLNKGRLSAAIKVADHSIAAKGRLLLPTSGYSFNKIDLRAIELSLTGPYLQAQAAGNLRSGLLGKLQVLPQKWGHDIATLILPQQTFELAIDLLSAPTVQLAGLRYGLIATAGAQWSGSLPLRYVVQSGQAKTQRLGLAKLRGQGEQLALLLSGVAQGKVSLLPKFAGELSSDLQPFLPSIARLQAGNLRARFSGEVAEFSSEGSRYAGQPLTVRGKFNWRQGWRATAEVRHLSSVLPITFDGEELRLLSGHLSAASLASLLGQSLPDLQGNMRLAGRLPLGGEALARADFRADVALSRQQQKLAGQLWYRQGRLTAKMLGQLSSELRGQLLGEIWPKPFLRLTGNYGSDNLQATLQAHKMLIAASSEAGVLLRQQGQPALKWSVRAKLGATQLAAQLKHLSPRAENVGGVRLAELSDLNNWLLSGNLQLPDLRQWSSQRGSATAQLGGNLATPRLQVAAQLDDMTASGQLSYGNGKLKLAAAQLILPQEWGKLSLAGPVWPSPELQVSAVLKSGLGNYSGSLTGSYQQPELRLMGALAHQQIAQLYGWQLGSTLLEVHLIGRSWSLNLAGKELHGNLRGEIQDNSQLLGLQQADLHLDTRYRSNDIDLRAAGQLAWNLRRGWQGRSQVWGRVFGQKIDSQLRGNASGKGELFANLQTRLPSGQLGQLQAILPSNLPLKPQAQLQLKQLDLGAFWGKSEQVLFSGKGQLGGNTWQQPQLSFMGQAIDSLDQLTGQIEAEWHPSADNALSKLRWQGPKLQLVASLQGQNYRAKLHSAGLDLQRIVPTSWQFKRLIWRGRATVSGELSTGIKSAEMRYSRLEIEQKQLGKMQAGGWLNYQPQRQQVGADFYLSLDGSGETAAGGFVKLRGQLPAGLSLQARHLRLSYPNLGQLSAEANLQLGGALGQPRLSGTFAATHSQAKLTGQLSGRLQAPKVLATVQSLRPDLQGTLYLQASQLDLQQQTVQAKVTGSLRHSSGKAQIALAGKWPQLAGKIALEPSAELLPPMLLTGQGTGHYQLAAGEFGSAQFKLGRGWLPKISGKAQFKPLVLLAKAIADADTANIGEALVTAQIAGKLNSPQLAGQWSSSSLNWQNARLPAMQGTFRWAQGAASAELLQVASPESSAKQANLIKQGKIAIHSNNNELKLQNIQLLLAEQSVKVSGAVRLPLQAKLQLDGGQYGQLAAHYRASTGYLKLLGELNYQQYRGQVDLWGHRLTGWHGGIDLSAHHQQPKQHQQGATDWLTQPIKLRVAGQYQQPNLQGQVELAGAKAKIFADSSGLQLHLQDGDQAAASGLLGLRPTDQGWQWYGAANFERNKVYGTLSPSGLFNKPQALLTLRHAAWQASGFVKPDQAYLELSDGENSGEVVWNGQTVRAQLHGLDLARLGYPKLVGLITLHGEFDPRSLTTLAASQTVHQQVVSDLNNNSNSNEIIFSLKDFELPQSLPYLDLPLAGTLNGRLQLKQGLWQLASSVELQDGLANLQLRQQANGVWQSSLALSLQKSLARRNTVDEAKAVDQTSQQGRLIVNLNSQGKGIYGSIQSSLYPLKITASDNSSTTKGQNALPFGLDSLTLSGLLKLDGQQISGDMWTNTRFGRVDLNLLGGLFDLLPEDLQGQPLAQQAKQFFGLSSQGSYRLEARADDVQLRQSLRVQASAWQMPIDWHGSLSGRWRLQPGGSTFSLSLRDFGPKDQPVQAQVRGSTLGDDWGLAGYFGSSEFTGRLRKGILSLQADLRALPVGRLISALTGELPGEGSITGIARLRLPLADPSAVVATVVAERVKVSATSQDAAGQPLTETLTGQGSLRIAEREIKNLNLNLQGAGTWQISGQYTKKNVDLQAEFDNTTFTPILRFLPAIANLQPALAGTVSLNISGSYDQPLAFLSGRRLRGSLAGNTISLPALTANLRSDGELKAAANLQTSGAWSSRGHLKLQALFAKGQLSDTRLDYAGKLQPRLLGTLPNVEVSVTQSGSALTTSPQSDTNTASTWQIVGKSSTPAIANPANLAEPIQPAGYLSFAGTLSPKLKLAINAQDYNLPIERIYAKESQLNASLELASVEEGDLLRVRGMADFRRLVLGRLPQQAQSLLDSGNAQPANASAVSQPPPSAANMVTDENSPLPDKYLRFVPDSSDNAGNDKKVAENGDDVPRSRPLLERFWLDNLRLTASGGIRIDENLVRAKFATSGLNISGTAAHPVISGELEALRGSLFVRENEFRLSEGSIKFLGTSIYPQFKLQAAGTVPSEATEQQVPIGIEFVGNFPLRARGGERELLLKTNLRCLQEGLNCINPYNNNPYSEAELYALVATGLPNLERLPQNIGLLGSSALKTTLNVFLLGEIERSLARSFGVDYIRLTPTFSSQDGVNATFSIGSYLTKEIFVQYQTDLSGNGLFGARYNTPDGHFSFKVSVPFSRMELQTIRPSFSAEYNFRQQTSLSIGLQLGGQTSASSERQGVKFNFGVVHRFY